MSQATLAFNEVTFSPVQQANQLWIRSTELANALGYKKGSDSITKIYSEHSDEFTANMTQVIEIVDTPDLGVTGNLLNTVRVFSLRGCHLVAMFSRTAVAKEFRKWVLDVLESLTPQSTTPTALTPSTTLSRKPLTSIVKVWAKQTDQKFSHCYSQVNAYFNLEGVAELPVEWIPDAIAFVQTRLDEHNAQAALEASKPDFEPSEMFIIEYEKKVTADYQKKALKGHKDADLLQENYYLWRRTTLLEKLLVLYEREQPEKPWGLSR